MRQKQARHRNTFSLILKNITSVVDDIHPYIKNERRRLVYWRNLHITSNGRKTINQTRSMYQWSPEIELCCRKLKSYFREIDRRGSIEWINHSRITTNALFSCNDIYTRLTTSDALHPARLERVGCSQNSCPPDGLSVNCSAVPYHQLPKQILNCSLVHPMVNSPFRLMIEKVEFWERILKILLHDKIENKQFTASMEQSAFTTP